MKQPKLSFGKASPKKKGKNPWESDSEDGGDSDGDMSLHSNDGIEEAAMVLGEISLLDDSVMMSPKKEVDIGDTDSEFEEPAPKPKKTKAAPAPKKVKEEPKASPPKAPSADDLFANAFGGSASDSSPPAPKAVKPKKEKAPKAS